MDGGWYRAKIINIPSPNEVEVCYIDFGNCERTALQDIKSLAPAFYQPAVQAVKCCLLGAKEKWNANECETFEILVLEQQLVVDVKSVGKTISFLSACSNAWLPFGGKSMYADLHLIGLIQPVDTKSRSGLYHVVEHDFAATIMTK